MNTYDFDSKEVEIKISNTKEHDKSGLTQLALVNELSDVYSFEKGEFGYARQVVDDSRAKNDGDVLYEGTISYSPYIEYDSYVDMFKYASENDIDVDKLSMSEEDLKILKGIKSVLENDEDFPNKRDKIEGLEPFFKAMGYKFSSQIKSLPSIDASIVAGSPLESIRQEMVYRDTVLKAKENETDPDEYELQTQEIIVKPKE